MLYRHTQPGTLMRVVLGISILAGAYFATVAPMAARTIYWVVVGFLLILLAMFHSLTVEVDTRCVQWYFGPGWHKWKRLISDLESARISRNKWYYGWGIRITPIGWLYNVSGFQCVDVTDKYGKSFRIGTNDPEGLLRALRHAGIRTD